MRWNDDVCNEYILYPEALKIVATAAIGVIFILRVRAIFGRDMWITGFAWTLLAVELGLKIVSFPSWHCDGRLLLRATSPGY